MARNIELIEKVMQHIKDHPENHSQAVWVSETECGTTACFAGWTLLMTGARCFGLECLYGEDGRLIVDVPNAARRLLGIGIDDADVLFYQIKTCPALELAVKDLVNGNGRLLPGERYEELARGTD
jgi:hypothetical protein